MEADKTSQLSALLACRSRADLRRLRGMDSSSFPFITLACKHNRADLLKLLLKDTSDAPVVVPCRCPVEQEVEGHNAFYYAIRSSNVELFLTLLGSVTPELSERVISESYEELLLNNVLVSVEMHLLVQYKLLDLRFFCKGDGALPATSAANIQERIQLLVENIAHINTYSEVDSDFLYTAKFIAQNIHILKHQLKSTYNILPWEEMEFCLVSFVSAHIHRQELNLFYLSVLKKERLLKELIKFASALQELEEHIVSTDIWELLKPVTFGREDVSTAISSRYPHLYSDYKEVRDISSLHMIKTYLDMALLADPVTRLGQLTIKRALQVTGEHLKNTLDSPKLSPAVSELLLLSAPKETRKVLQDLRLSLSHPHPELEDPVLYSNIQNDIKKIASVIIDITYSSKVKKIKYLLTMLVNSDSVDECLEIANIFHNISIVDVQETDTVTKGHRKIEDFIEEIITKIVDQTPYEKKLFAEIKYVLKKSKLQHQLTVEDYLCIKAIDIFFKFHDITKEREGDVIRAAKFVANNALRDLPSQKYPVEIERHVLLGSLLTKFYDSVSMRIKPEIANEIQLAIAIIYFTGSIDECSIKCIDEYGRQLLLNKFNKINNGRGKCKSVKNSGEITSKQLNQKLTELGKTVGTDRMCGQLHEHLSTLYKDVTGNRLMIEVLVLDIMSLLDSSTKCVPNNVLYLDGDLPLLSGKCLRNHLAHGNALVDILPTDARSAILLNAIKLTETKDLLLNRKIGNIFMHNIKLLRRRYERGLSILDKQKEMWKSLLDGNFDNFTLGIAGGADIFSRKEDLSSTLHYAARGPNIETIKFLTKQEMFSTEVRDANGQTALHIAATFGRDVIVKFLVAEMGNAINQVDNAGETPLHLASRNGHKKTVMALISLGAKTTNKDITGRSPLHYAVMNNYLNVVKILLKKGAAVDENTVNGGATSLHLAAEFGHVEIVQFLLLNEADVNAKTKLGFFPLHLAAFNGHQEVVKALLEKGAHLNLKAFRGQYPLHFAVENNHNETVKILLDKGAFVNNGNMDNHTPFHTAVLNGNALIVGLLLQRNANVNRRRNDGFTPLHFAAKGGYADIVDLLLQNDALAHSRDVNGSTPLHFAAKGGHTSVVETLIRRGIDIHAQDTYKATPLHLAARAGHRQVVEILLAAGANVHSRDKEGNTALHLSARNGHEAVLEALMKKEAKLNCKNNNNYTPIYEAAFKTCNEKTIQMLLKYGADVNEKGECSSTALHIASLVGNSSVVEALLHGKADVDAQAEGGTTALHLAARGNHKAVVEILLKYGVDVNLLEANGSSALCYAAKNNNIDLLNILIAKGADVNFGSGKLLLSAMASGHRLVVEALLKNKNVDINIKDQDGLNLLYTAALSGDALLARALIKRGIKVADCVQDPSPLLIAICEGHTEFVEVLLENGANVNPADPKRSPLCIAVHMNKPDIMERLLHWGADPNIRDFKNRTPLELAILNAQMPNTLTLLQQVGASINDRGNDDWTLLHMAAQAGNLEVTKLLIDRGADINARNRLGSKPIHIATREGHPHILTFFLELGMSIDDPGSAGWTLMHCAAGGGHLAVAQYLMDKHIHINSIDLNGCLPIHYSALQGHTEMVKLLLHSGAVYDAMDYFGRTPADLAKSRDIKELLESIEKLFKAVKRNDILTVGILVKDLAKYVDAKSSDNATLLHIASWKSFQEVCDILLKSKANPSAVGKGGNTPLHYASKFSHPGIVETLLKNGAAHNHKADNMKTPLDFATHKDIKSLLQMVELCFRKVQTCNVRVVKDLTKIKNVEIIKAVMKARDTDGNTLVVLAMKNGFPDIEELKQVSQVNVPHILSKVDSMFMLERFTEAIDILKQLLNERIEILGEDNPGTLDIQYKIMIALFKQSKYFEAMPMLEDIYKKRVKVLGPHHPDSLKTRSCLALLFHRLGRNEESWDIIQTVMLRQQEMLGEGHEELLQTKTHAGLVLHALGKYEEALSLNNQVYKRYKNTLGAHHPETLCLQNNIAMVLCDQGKAHEAFALYQTVYETRKKILGLNHSETLSARSNMANVLFSQNKLDEALPIFQETLAIQKNVLGLNHSDTICTQSLMKRLYLCQKNVHDALKVHKAGINARNATFGPDHPTFQKIDGFLDNFDKFLKSKLEIDAGYVPPCDVYLLNAASEGDSGVVRSLLENGSDVNAADGEGRTALHFATTVEVVELLLDSGANATAVSHKGNTPLHLATSRTCRKTVHLLLQNVKRTKLNAYCNFVNAKTVVGGSTALHVAAKKGATDIVSCLLAHGACYNSRDRSANRTPLQCSSSPSVTRLLCLAEKVFEMAGSGSTELPQGDERHLAAVVNSRDTEHRTPLQLAAVHRHTATARLLARLLKPLD